MPIFSFDHFQLHQLTVVASSIPQENSPLLLSSLAALADITDPSIADASLAELQEVGLIKRFNNQLHLAPELEPLFYVLSNPDRVWRFYRQARVDEGEVYFCWKQGVAVQMVVLPAYSAYQLIYPHDLNLAENWFTHEFMADLVPKASRFDPLKVFVDHTEMLLISIMQLLYAQKAKQYGALKDEQLWIPINAVMQFDGWERLPSPITEMVSEQDLSFYFGRSGALAEVVASLAVKDLIDITEDSISFSAMSLKMFNPGAILDFAQVFDYGNDGDSTVRNMMVLEDGYLLQQPSKKGNRVCIEYMPGNIPISELFRKLIRVKYVKVKPPAQETKTAAAAATKKAKPSKKGSQTEKRFCHNCGAQIKNGAAFCRNCGQSLEMVVQPKKRFCRNCGYELREGTVFCPKCGHKNA